MLSQANSVSVTSVTFIGAPPVLSVIKSPRPGPLQALISRFQPAVRCGGGMRRRLAVAISLVALLDAGPVGAQQASASPGRGGTVLLGLPFAENGKLTAPPRAVVPAKPAGK